MPIHLARCPECRAALEQRHLHCHEVVVQHVDGSLECAGGRCTVDVRVHRFVVPCAEVDCADCGVASAELVDELDLPLAA